MSPSAAELPEIDADVRTIADLPFHVMGRVPRAEAVAPCQSGQVAWTSSKDFFERIRDTSLGLSSLGMARGERVAIISESRPEWLMCDLAVLAAGGVIVPI